MCSACIRGGNHFYRISIQVKMEKTSQTVYNKIDNNLYNEQGDIWWDSNACLHLLKSSVNPWRVKYATKVLSKLGINADGKSALEVGCGGGNTR